MIFLGLFFLTLFLRPKQRNQGLDRTQCWRTGSVCNDDVMYEFPEVRSAMTSLNHQDLCRWIFMSQARLESVDLFQF